MCIKVEKSTILCRLLQLTVLSKHFRLDVFAFDLGHVITPYFGRVHVGHTQKYKINNQAQQMVVWNTAPSAQIPFRPKEDFSLEQDLSAAGEKNANSFRCLKANSLPR